MRGMKTVARYFIRFCIGDDSAVDSSCGGGRAARVYVWSSSAVIVLGTISWNPTIAGIGEHVRRGELWHIVPCP